MKPPWRRAWVYATAGAIAAVDLAAKAWAERSLTSTGIEAGPVDLRLAYNPGVAFSVAADAPAALVITVTGLVTTAVAVVIWRIAARAVRTQAVAMAAVLGGAVANLIDRAGDGVVTDYLHTGWWPTFNLADVAIVTGAALALLTSLRRADGRAPTETAVATPRAQPDAGEASGAASHDGLGVDSTSDEGLRPKRP